MFHALKSIPNCFVNTISFTADKIIVNTWHECFGHCSFKVFKQILSQCNLRACKDVHFCFVCVCGKCHQSLNTYTKPLELIYIDVWGPSPVMASNGACYYVFFLDVYTKFTWIYVMHKKSQVINIFKTFKTLVENQTGHKICALQTDNVREYLSLTPFLHQHGIHHRLICPYTHEQNGSVERKHRHIVDMGLTLLVIVSLPLRFWAEAFIAFAHIISVLHTEVLNGNNPYHLLFQRQPNYNKFKLFGCACYPSLRPYNKRKFAFRSSCCLILGYSIQHACYICLTLEGKTIISRHVIFNESVFSYNDLTNRFEIDSASSQVSSEPLPSITVMQPCPMSSPSLVINNDSLSPSPSPHNHSASHILPSPPPISTANTQPMVTRAKLGIFKQKFYHTSLPFIPSPPTSVKYAIASPIWFTTMYEEYNALLSNNTLTLTSLPLGAPFVGCKWVYKTKLNAYDSLQRCKARLVAKGFHQTGGVDYAETFSPVVRHTTVRLVLAHVVASHWPIRQIDINDVFLDGDLTERVYTQQPPSFTSTDPHLVCHLHKAIYDLK